MDGRLDSCLDCRECLEGGVEACPGEDNGPTEQTGLGLSKDPIRSDGGGGTLFDRI